MFQRNDEESPPRIKQVKVSERKEGNSAAPANKSMGLSSDKDNSRMVNNYGSF